MAYVTQEQVGRARRLDLLSYLAACEPWELVRCGNGSYRTRTHDSLEISNGLCTGTVVASAAGVRWTI